MNSMLAIMRSFLISAQYKPANIVSQFQSQQGKSCSSGGEMIRRGAMAKLF